MLWKPARTTSQHHVVGGTVIDSAGAVIPGATISAINNATQDQYTTVTNAQGDYTIQFVKSGTYNITASHPGFQTITKGAITVDYNQTVRSDFTLPVGQVSEHVVVTAAAPPITTDDASVRETVGTRAVAELPLNGRDALQLAAITPGVLPGQKAASPD
jgi:hypothetical protein